MSSQGRRSAPSNSQYGKERGSDALHVQSKKDWHTLCSEVPHEMVSSTKFVFNLCKRKLEAKKEALLILAKELDIVRQEKEAYQLMAEQLREKFQTQRRKYEERERSLGLSLNESDPMSERRNHSLIQVLCEARQQYKKAEAEITDLRQKLVEAHGDIKLLRENIARQRIGDDDLGARHFPAHEREELVKQLEEANEKLATLQRDMVAKIDEQEEVVTERDFFRDKGDRLNQELNYVLGGDERRIVDIDALIMESKYLKERLKQCQEEKSTAQNTVAKYKSALEKRRGRGGLKLGATTSGGLIITQKQVEKLLAEGRAGSLPMTQSSIADLRSLASTLLETIHDKNMALNHQRNTNKILGTRVAELEKKLKTLEIAGLWNLPPGTDINSIACCMLGSGGSSGRSNFADLEKERMQGGITSLIPHQITPDSSEVGSIKSEGAAGSSISGSAATSPTHKIDGHGDKDSLISLLEDDTRRETKDTTCRKSSPSKFGIDRAASLDLDIHTGPGHLTSNAASILPHSNSLDLDVDPKQNVKDLLGDEMQALSSKLSHSSEKRKNQNILEAEMLSPEEICTPPAPASRSKLQSKDKIETEEKLISLEDDSPRFVSMSKGTWIDKYDGDEKDESLVSLGNQSSKMPVMSFDRKSGEEINENDNKKTKKDETLISLENESSLVSLDAGTNNHGDGKQEADDERMEKEEEDSVLEGEEDKLKKISAIIDEANEQKDTDVYIVDIEDEDIYDEDEEDERVVTEEAAPFLTASGEATMPSGMDEEQVEQFEGFFEGVADRIASKNLEKTMGVSSQGLPAEMMDGKVVEEGQDVSSHLIPKESEPRPLTVSGEEVDSLSQCV